MEQICFKCGELKPLFDFYKHPKMSNGHMGKCKECTKKETKKNVEIKSKNPQWLESEKTRHRLKYHRLLYKDKHKPTPESKTKTMKSYYDKYPEKYKAKIKTHRINTVNGHLHHWSYNESDMTSVFDLKKEDHYLIHRFLIYDQERMMYRRTDNNELLSTKELHSDYINHIKQLHNETI